MHGCEFLWHTYQEVLKQGSSKQSHSNSFKSFGAGTPLFINVGFSLFALICSGFVLLGLVSHPILVSTMVFYYAGIVCSGVTYSHG